MNKRLAIALLVAFAATSAHAQSRGHGGGSRGGGGYAVPRGHAPGGGYRGGGAVSRQPVPGGSYGYGYGGGHYRGHGYYGHRHGYYPYYRYPYYGYGYGYPYYRYPYYTYGAWPYAWGYGLGLGIGFYYGNGYAYASSGAPYVQAEYNASYQRAAEPEDRRPREEAGTEVGELRLQVGPEDAVVYVDGEFRGVASELVAVRLAPGRHRLEIVRPGYTTAEREVHIGRGASASLRIELEPEGERR